MGSSCSSAQRKAKKSGLSSEEQRRESVLSTDSIPYGKASPPAPRKTSDGRNNPPISQPAPVQPAPPQGNHAPLRKISSSPETPGLPDLQQFPEKVSSLLMGRFQDVQLSPSVRDINIYICADFKETSEERGQLREKVMPELRQHCAEKGYVLNWLDMYWGTELDEFREICLDTVLKEKAGRLLMLLLLDEVSGLGSILPPHSIEESDFQKAIEGMSTEEQKTLLQKWYRSDAVGRTLRKGCSPEQCQNLVGCLRSAWTEQDLRSKYLTSVLEEVVRQSVLKDSRLAKRSLWLLPRSARSPRQIGADEESACRFNQLRTRLQEQLPDAQKVAWGQGSADPLQDLCRLATGELKRMIDVLMEEDFVEEARRPYKGIETPLYHDLLLHAEQARHYCRSFVGRDDLLTSIRNYLTGAVNSPLVLHSPPGHGKSAILARAAQLASNWMPDTPVVLRFVGSTPDSMTPEQLLRSICEQLCALYGAHPAVAFKRLRDQEEPMGSLLEKVSGDRPLVVMIDGLEQIAPHGRRDLSWLTPELPHHVKVILTVQDNTPDMKTLQELLSGKEAYIAVPPLTANETLSVVENVMKTEGSVLTPDKKPTTNLQTSPLHATVLAHSYLQFDQDEVTQVNLSSSAEDLVKSRISTLEAAVGVVKIILGLLASARYGLSDGEMLDLLIQTGSFDKPHLVWTVFKRRLDDFLRTLVVGGTKLVTYRSATIRTLCCGQNFELDIARQALRDYFRSEGSGHLWPNRRKMDELTYCQHHLGDPPLRDCLLEPDWLMQKVAACDPYTLLEELDMVNCDEDSQLRLLYEVIQRSGYALRYDGSQLMTQLYIYLTPIMISDGKAEELPALERLHQLSRRPPVSSLLPLSPIETSTFESDGEGGPSFTALHTIRDRRSHVLSLTPSGGEIVVWDVYRQTAVRTLTGVVEPKDVRMIDDRRALVLCGRELKVYDLEEGRLLSKLKGVMNQQMAYFGLHDENYVVALSRNRMYVNMMSVKTGDLETTFKVGEDRFLNSLLVSSNGRICVCGDETQKPFPLLVWDLANRKLLYDLRIPHHEFLTRMSAISHDGHYVVCVCREIDDGSPNFIIVYDLQSGTLFKKWKPESNSCSIAISSHGGCVINGLENTLVLVWDLSTGARRFNLQGHTAPVDQIKMDDQGVNCLTYDSFGRDRSIRVWDVAKGECLAVYTPQTPVRCAQLSLDGLTVVAGLEGRPGIATLLLCQNKSLEEMLQPTTGFGDQAHEGGVFDVSQQG